MPEEVIETKPEGGTAKRRFNALDFSFLAEYVVEERDRRKRNRADLERQWKEIDRQILMKPSVDFKKLPNGRVDRTKRWMSELELPLQAQALEVLTADARRMLFSSGESWFRAHSQTTDEYFEAVENDSIILGDRNDVPSRIDQDNVDKLAEGFLLHIFSQMDFAGRMDRINAEAFKYGMGVGRARMETKSVFVDDARGVMRQTVRMPSLVPTSVKNNYLDEMSFQGHTSHVLGPAHIAEDYMPLTNLKVAASKGSTDFNNPNGGWMPGKVGKLEGDDNDCVVLLEMEGDIVIPRKTTRNMLIPNAIVTVAVGGKSGNSNNSQEVVRFRRRGVPESTYLLHPYHYEGATDAYPASPLMKGRPIQIMATDALNRLMDSAMLKNAPPVSYDRSDMFFAESGGPIIAPYAVWASIDATIKVHSELGGEPGTLSSILSSAINLYAELTGVLPSRLGAQTVSHTTAFAKDAEIQRGASRTVDYVQQIGHGPMTTWLDRAYRMGRASIGANERVEFYIPAYGGFVSVRKEHLPEKVSWEWFGSAGPAEERETKAQKLQALQLAIQMDNLAIQLRRPPTLNLPAAIQHTLRDGGWTDVDVITSIAESSDANQAAPSPEGAVELNPGTQIAAVQGLTRAISGGRS